MTEKYGFRLILVGIFLILFTFGSKGSEGSEVEDASTAACRHVMGLFMKHVLEGIGTCSKTMEFKNMKDRASKFQLTPSGGVERATLEAFVKNEVPENLRERAIPLLFACHEKHAGSVNPNEEYCKSYRPFMKCFLDSLPVFCPTPA